MLQRLNIRPQTRTNVQPCPTRQNTKQTQFSGLHRFTFANSKKNNEKALQKILNDKHIPGVLKYSMKNFDKKIAKMLNEKTIQVKNLPDILSVIKQNDKWFIAGVSGKEKIDFNDFCTKSRKPLDQQLSNFFTEQKKIGTFISEMEMNL